MKREVLEEIINSQKNLIVDGDVASGKTTNVLFPLVDEMINKKESMFILDSREEYINEYYDKLKENDYNIITINLRDLDKSDGWNPFEYPHSLYKKGKLDQAQEYIEKIGKTMFYENTNADPFWAYTASDFMTGVTLGLFEDGKEDEINLNSVNNMFNGVDSKYATSDYITTYFNMKDKASAPYIYASTTFLAPKETKGGILSVARQKLRLFVSREKLSKILNKTTFSYEKLLNTHTAIIFINKDENKSLNAISAMFIEQLFNILIDNKSSNRFNFVVDNFDSIEHINDLVEMLSSATSRNIKFLIVTRSLDELINKYGNYVSKLSNLLVINNDKLRLNISGLEKDVDKQFNEVIIKSSNIEYPKLNENPIKIFDLQKFVIDKKKDNIANSFTNPFDNVPELPEFPGAEKYKNKSLEELISNIDKKIEEIEAEEYKDIKEHLNTKDANISKFKIEDTL